MEEQAVERIALHLLQALSLKLGKVSVQDLSDQFSRLLLDLRKRFSSSEEIKGLLMRNSDIFSMNKEIVNELQKPRDFVDASRSWRAKAGSDDDDQEEEEEEEEEEDDDDDDDGGENYGCEKNSLNGLGNISKIFPKYAFIKYSNYNFETFIYFDVQSFENGQHENLEELEPNEKVCFHAKPSAGQSAPYRATAVWRVGRPLSRGSKEHHQSSTKSLTLQDFLQSQDLEGNFRKIAELTRQKAGNQGNDILCATRSENPNIEETQKLGNFLTVEDFVYFSATQSGNKNKEFVKSRTQKKTVKNYSKKGRNNTGSSTEASCSYHALGQNLKQIGGEKHSDKFEKKRIRNQVGKICNLSGNMAIIRFGKNGKAIVPPNTVYKHTKLIEQLEWELDEGAEVKFDAELCNSNWRAILVWIGDKPKETDKISYRERTEQMGQSLLSEINKKWYCDNENSGGMRRFKSFPELDDTNAKELFLEFKNMPKGTNLTKAENSSKAHPEDKSKKISTKHRKNKDSSKKEAKSSTSVAYLGTSRKLVTTIATDSQQFRMY